MTGKSRWDLAVDRAKKRFSLAKEKMKVRSEGERPFRQEPVSAREQLVEYDELTPEMKATLSQQFGSEITQPYFDRMEKLKRRY